jgi:hypothetical protein
MTERRRSRDPTWVDGRHIPFLGRRELDCNIIQCIDVIHVKNDTVSNPAAASSTTQPTYVIP